MTEKLRARGCTSIVSPRSAEYDLVEMDAVKRLYADAKPTVVIHLAVRVGGIRCNSGCPQLRLLHGSRGFWPAESHWAEVQNAPKIGCPRVNPASN